MAYIDIPDKLYFKIGEVSKILAIKPYVLRYWETEFKEISPHKSRSNQRLYKKRDVEVLVQVKSLLYEEGFTIEGARKKVKELLKSEKEANKKSQMDFGFSSEGSKKFLAKVRRELSEILDVL
jgi:DNA-binding transcriptional MerR regulator